MKWLLCACVFLASVSVFGQQMATTDDGKRIVLYSNYTWRLADGEPAKNPAAVEDAKPTQPKTETAAGETTPTGKTIYTGPRGGRYHYSKSGKKVYERKRR